MKLNEFKKKNTWGKHRKLEVNHRENQKNFCDSNPKCIEADKGT